MHRTEILIAADAQATRAIGAALGQLLRPGALVLLSGPLGAGKTTFVQGIAAGLGIKARVHSPTFTLVHEYPLAGSGQVGLGSSEADGTPQSASRLVHMDFYRLSGPAEAGDLGLDDYLAGDDIVVIEWPEHAGGALPSTGLWVTLALAEAEPAPDTSIEAGMCAAIEHSPAGRGVGAKNLSPLRPEDSLPPSTGTDECGNSRYVTFEAHGEAAAAALAALVEHLTAHPVENIEHIEPADG